MLKRWWTEKRVDTSLPLSSRSSEEQQLLDRDSTSSSSSLSPSELGRLCASPRIHSPPPAVWPYQRLQRIKQLAHSLIHRYALPFSLCCCPQRVRRSCLSNLRWAYLYLACFLILIIVLVTGVALAFYHVWDLYSDTPSGSCFRSDEEMNVFRYLLRSFDEVAQQHGITYWLDFGVLLGGARRGDVLPWDRDLDISMLYEDIIRVQRNRTVRRAFEGKGLFFCPYRLCVKPLWTVNHWPDMDINAWTIEGQKVRYYRPGGKEFDAMRESVYTKYYDFDLDLLYPLQRMPVASLSLPVPKEHEQLLQHRYPHSYSFSLPYNPRCWWGALTSAWSAPSDPFAASQLINITQPSNVHEDWGAKQLELATGIPQEYVFSAKDGIFVRNPVWVKYQANRTATIMAEIMQERERQAKLKFEQDAQHKQT